jgi:ubiquinone/menaquinone biosynthesis C-methylase UbiE
LSGKGYAMSQCEAVPVNLETLRACPICGEAGLSTIDGDANLCACAPCQYIFDNPRPRLEDLIAFYSQPGKYASWLAEEHGRDALWKRRLKKLLRYGKPGSLLDVGAGIGQFLHFARPHFSVVAGTEVSRSAVEIAERKYGVSLILGELEAVDFGAEQFDNITVFHVLEHVPNPRSVIEKCQRLLRPDGILVVAVPNDVRSAKAKVKHLLKSMGIGRFQKLGDWGLPKIALDGSLAEIHLSHFTAESLRRLLERCGFTVLRDSLDPYYSSRGMVKARHAAYYLGCRTLKSLSGFNLYDTILTIARKQGGVS